MILLNFVVLEQNMIKKESASSLVEFLSVDDNMQRNLFDEKAVSIDLIYKLL